MRRSVPALLVLVVASGCAPGPTDLDDPEHLRTWLTGASALGVYTPIHEPVGFAAGEVTFPDATCPVITESDTTVTIAGDCTASDGRRFVGQVTVTRGADGARDVTFEGFGAGDDPAPATGTVAIREVSPTEHTFDVDLAIDGFATTTYRYLGRVVGGYEGATTWSGEGDVEREGWTPVGVAHAVTVDQVRDPDVCGNAPASGSTTLTLDGRTLRVDYDGATACDEDRAAPYSIDGVEQGLVTGIGCAAAPGRGGALGGLVLGLAGLLAARSRRR